MTEAADSDSRTPLVIFVKLALAALGEVVAVTKKGKQLFRGAEARLTPGVDFLDLADEVLLGRLRLRSKLYHKCPSHHGLSVNRRCSGRRESSVQIALK